LPTFGRPTIATIGFAIGFPSLKVSLSHLQKNCNQICVHSALYAQEFFKKNEESVRLPHSFCSV